MKKIIAAMILTALCIGVTAQPVRRIGIIGLDTSHSTAFTTLINSGSDPAFSEGWKVVAAYPYGSRTIESSFNRIPGYIEKVKEEGVEICSSIAELLGKVDCVLLETNDGRMHLEQAAEVFKSGKPVYIDKPMGATLGETIAIYTLAAKYGVRTWSSSALRFSAETRKLGDGEYGKIIGADCYSPHHATPTHPDFGFYGIHGIESLYTVLGTGCKAVSRVHSEMGDIVTGVWEDGRLGTFRAISQGPGIYGGTAFGEKQAFPVGPYEGYKPLLAEILKFFMTGVPPVPEDEVIEIFAFMKASNMSVEKGGKMVSIEAAMKKGRKDARKLLRNFK